MTAATPSNSSSLEDQLELCDQHVDSKKLRNVYVAVFCVILAVAVIANGTVLYIIHRRGLWRDMSVLMIGNLAISDIMVCVAVLVPEISEWFGYWEDSIYSSIHLCRMHVVAEALFPTVTIFSLVVMSFERCRIARAKTVIQTRQTNRTSRYYVTLALVWMFALSASLPAMKACQAYHSIFFFVDDSGDFMTIFLLCRFILIYIIPLALIASFYCIMAATLHRSVKASRRASRELRTNHAGIIAHARRRRLAVMVLLMVVVFAVGWLPYYLFRFLFYSVDPVIFCTRVVLGHLKNFRLIFFCFLSLLNPCIVFVLGANFRRYLQDIFRCRDARKYSWNARRTTFSCNIGSVYAAPGERVDSVAEV